ncbi:MAG: glycoside hydrolase family 125 protein [Candidatus Eremiobacteraeota bacterium]|nr:glycoside hydrolase family 125 protein [Candidatus Eremiobacteraeota bacterium]
MNRLRRLFAACATALVVFCAIPADLRAQALSVSMTDARNRPIEPESLFHTLFADFFSEPDGTTYVQTGDIPAMWLRDSSAQTLPYVRFATYAPILAVRIDRVVQRDARNILIDSYANAFQANYHVWERKWEVDSLAWPVLLAWLDWRNSGERAIFTPQLHSAFRRIVATYACEQKHAQCSHYRDERAATQSTYNPDTGMIWDAFRPSDDAVTYRFNIPQEAIAVAAMQDIAVMAELMLHDYALSAAAKRIAADVTTGILRYGRVYVPANGGWMYAYETDGDGHYLFADDANVPNLTSLPALEWCSSSDPDYLNTRAFALSSKNPWFFRGRYAEGLGSPHTPRGYVWPLGIIARALTSTSSSEVAESVTTLAETDSADGLIHESFSPDGYWRFTRSEFGWANAFYAELIFRSVAGFDSPSLTPYGPILFGEVRSQTPVLARPVIQLSSAGAILNALSHLLARANGRDGIPRNQSAADAFPTLRRPLQSAVR